MTTGRTVGGIGAVTKVRVRMMHAGGEVMFNSDLIFLARIPIVVLVWEQRPHGDYPAVTVTLDPKYLHKINWRTRSIFMTFGSKTLERYREMRAIINSERILVR